MVGGVGTVFHYSILIVLVEQFKLGALASSIAGSIGGALVNFVLSHQVVFKSKKKLSNTAPRFFSVVIVGIMINALLMYAFVHRLAIGYITAQLMATAIVLMNNYFLNAYWTFKKPKS